MIKAKSFGVTGDSWNGYRGNIYLGEGINVEFGTTKDKGYNNRDACVCRIPKVAEKLGIELPKEPE